MTENQIVEALAAYAHEAWAGWMNYLFGKSQHNKDGSVNIPAGYVKNLQRLIDMPYQEMPEVSKQSDRVEANKMLSLVHKYFAEDE